jgi:two-component system phosphate regulon sensor histidine kinase PhoR
MMCGRTILQSSPLTLEKLFPAPEFARTFKKVLESGKPASATSTLPIGDEAVPRYFSFKVAPVQKQRGGGVYGAIGIFHDITELKKAEQIRIEFVQNVSHELRTPLTSIKGYTDTLAQDIKNGELSVVDQCLERISRNSERLLNLVNDILDLSSLESNTADLRKQIVSTREVTEHALHQLEERRKAKQHDITMNFHVDSVPGDSRRIEQVILNLVENAIKYIPAGKQIDITWDEDRRGSIVLRVRDNGPGISGTDQDRLFERFYRVDKARSRDSGGTGLGLAIVKHIMIRHGGTVDVRSEIGIGTEFTCTFPRL